MLRGLATVKESAFSKSLQIQAWYAHTDRHFRAIGREALRELSICCANEGDINLLGSPHRARARRSSKGNGKSENVGELHLESNCS